MEVAAKFLLPYRNGLEEKSFPSHLYIQGCQFPKARRDFFLLHVKLSALIELTKQSSSKFHFMSEMT